MSGKRRAETELTRDNWDNEDEPQSVGVFQKASENELKNRVIRTARRRVTTEASNPEQKSLFSGFKAFANNTADSKKPFSFSTSLSTVSKSAFSLSPDKSKPMSGDSNSKSTTSAGLSFSESKSSKFSLMKSGSDSTQPELISNQNKLDKLSEDLKITANAERSDKNGDIVKNSDEKTSGDIFRQKLRSLNLLCAEWIIKHLNENLSYILTPIFDDYKKHLTRLREDLKRTNSTNMLKLQKTDSPKAITESSSIQSSFKTPDFKDSFSKVSFGSKTDLFLSKTNETKNESCNSNPPSEDKPAFGFGSFDQKNETPQYNFSMKKTDPRLFKFTAEQEESKINDELENKPVSMFSFNSTANTASGTLFNQNCVSKAEEPKAEADEDCPPVIDDAVVTEEGSIFDKKCKVFIKKNGTFVDHGVGFLFLKLVGKEKKCQIIIRANNKVANIIINVLLSSNVPVKKMEKNNVMIICCPTPDVKQPTSVLIRVKTAEDVEELIETLNKYKT